MDRHGRQGYTAQGCSGCKHHEQERQQRQGVHPTEVPFVAPETNRKVGKTKTGGIPLFRGFTRSLRTVAKSFRHEGFVARSFRTFAKSFRQEVLSSLCYFFVVWTSCDTTSAGKEESEKTEESGSLLKTILYIFAMYLVKPLHCDYAVYVVVSTGYYIHCIYTVLYARFNKQLVLGYVVARLDVRERKVVPSSTW